MAEGLIVACLTHFWLFVIGIEQTPVPCVVREQQQVVSSRPLDDVKRQTPRETDPASTLEQQMKERPSKITNIGLFFSSDTTNFS